MDSTNTGAPHPETDGNTRRDFLYLTAGAMGVVAAGCAAWPLVDSLNPAADTLALASIEVDVSAIEAGQTITVVWRGKPVFIHRRSEAEINEIRSEDWKSLRDPQSDQERVLEGHDEWLVLVGICTHLGCIPMGSKVSDVKGDYNGWFCPCHGSHYDKSGRIRKGPAPTNLAIPPYTFKSDTLMSIG